MNRVSFDKQSLNDLVQDYFKSTKAQDANFQDSIENQTLKIVFGILSKFSYTLFSFAFAYTLLNGDFQRYRAYFNSKQANVLLFFIAFIAILSNVILKEVKTDNNIKPQQKKIYNVCSDILRLILYVLLLIFVIPLTLKSQTGQAWEVASFYIFAFAILLFIVRKLIKWIYFFGEGRNIMAPWESKDINNQNGMKEIANFIDFYLKRNGGNTIQNEYRHNNQKNFTKIQENNQISQQQSFRKNYPINSQPNFHYLSGPK